MVMGTQGDLTRLGSGIPAPASRVLAGIGIDLVVLAAVVALVAAAASSARSDLVAASLVVALLLLGAQVVAWSHSGRTLGWWTTGVRQVTAADSSPPGLGGVLSPSWFADLRRGRDPLLPSLPAAPLVLRPADAAPPQESPRAAPRARSILLVDGRAAGTVGDGVVLGRTPVARAPERAVAVADIGRRISRSHLALRPDASGRIWAVDLGSTNGSVVVGHGGAERPLAEGSRVALAPGDLVRIGEHEIAVQFVTDVRI